MTKSWSVPFPESETEHDGMPVFWRFQATVEEDGIKIFALQYIAFHQTEHYAWLVPAHWIVDFKPAPNQWLQEWKQRRNVTNGAIVIHTQRLKSDPGGNLLS